MNTFTQGVLTGLIPSLFVSVLTAFVTVKLSTKQFFSQKWWKKNAEAYSKIIEGLSYLQYFFGEFFDETTNIKRIDYDESTEMHYECCAETGNLQVRYK